MTSQECHPILLWFTLKSQKQSTINDLNINARLSTKSLNELMMNANHRHACYTFAMSYSKLTHWHFIQKYYGFQKPVWLVTFALCSSLLWHKHSAIMLIKIALANNMLHKYFQGTIKMVTNNNTHLGAFIMSNREFTSALVY